MHEALQKAESSEALGSPQVSLGLHINDLQQYNASLEWTFPLCAQDSSSKTLGEQKAGTQTLLGITGVDE